MKHLLNRRGAIASILSAWTLPRAASAQSAPLEIGVLPNLSPRVLLAQYQPLREHLARELKRPVQISTAPNWSAFHQRTLGLEYDVAITAAHLARVAQIDRGLVPIVSYLPDIKGMVIHATDRPLAGLADLRGRTLVLSNPQSLVSLRGMQWLREKGLERDADFKTIATPTDDSVGSVVVRGDAIAAMLSGGEYRAIPEATKARLQVLAVFAEVPGFVVMASPRLSAADRRGLEEQLLRFATQAEEGRTFFANTGFTGMRVPPAGLMESMDPYVEVTRRMLQPAG